MATIFAGGESGNLGFDFEQGATRHFVVALIRFEDPDTARQAIEKFKAARQLAGRDLAFHELAIHQWSERIFDFFEGLPFQGWVLVVNKKDLPYPYTLIKTKSLYALFVSEVVALIPFTLRDGANLVLDEYDQSGWVLHQVRQLLKARGLPIGFKKIVARWSSSEPLIQVADLVAGAAHQAVVSGERTLFDKIAKKVVVAEFEG